ncbi:MAG: tetratricopeptide repeat protein [Bacteroidales bacterium]|nr:tetratricopeptide repeat protein [Bacteroidales bacterium]
MIKIEMTKIVWLLCLAVCIGWLPMKAEIAMPETTAECDSMIHTAVVLSYHKGDYSTGLSMLEKVHSAAVANHWPKQEFLALNNIGLIYQIGGSYGEALEYLNRAFGVAAATLKNGESKTTLNNIAIVYTKSENYLKAIEYFGKAFEIAESDKDAYHTGMYALNLAEAFINTGNLAEAKRYLAIAEDNVSDNLYLKAVTDGHRVAIALANSDYAEVINLGQKFVTDYSGTDDARFLAPLNKIYYDLAKAYFYTGRRAEAEDYLKQSMGPTASLEQKVESFNFYSRLSLATGNFRKAIECKDSVIVLKDSIYSLRDTNLLEVSKARFEVQQAQYELLLKENQLKSARLTLIISVIALLIVVVLVGWAVRSNIMKLRMQRKTEESLRVAAEQRLHTQQAEAQLEQQQLQSRIEKQNRQLAARALYLSERDRILENTVTALENPDEKSATASRQISELKTHLDHDREWQEFSELFEQTNDGLILKIRRKHPELNSNDLRFLIYVYMNFSNKEIASMLNITQDATRKRRERISKKLGLPSGADLYSYLISFVTLDSQPAE